MRSYIEAAERSVAKQKYRQWSPISKLLEKSPKISPMGSIEAVEKSRQTDHRQWGPILKLLVSRQTKNIANESHIGKLLKEVTKQNIANGVLY
ncbi:hypothetical protein AVEN_15389-1 [Araneus ventricosus]|uniref:Uncharacterized protein n=1 Tax=Araneus ventricosus TaxID=182803 RepID=A0A4Y2MDU2_ARAVE|nr:hypothetical protein AVEN_15389-1 [Araneus ventricosus]